MALVVEVTLVVAAGMLAGAVAVLLLVSTVGAAVHCSRRGMTDDDDGNVLFF